MNNDRFHCIGEGVVAMVCACDVMQTVSLMGGPIGPPSTFLLETLHQLTMKRCLKANCLGLGEGRGSHLCFVAGGDDIYALSLNISVGHLV